MWIMFVFFRFCASLTTWTCPLQMHLDRKLLWNCCDNFWIWVGFYDIEHLAWKGVVDTVLVSACAPTGGGRHPISQRLLKHFWWFDNVLKQRVAPSRIYSIGSHSQQIFISLSLPHLLEKLWWSKPGQNTFFKSITDQSKLMTPETFTSFGQPLRYLNHLLS